MKDNHMINSTDAEKASDKPQTSHERSIQQIRNRRELPQLDKGHLWKTHS